ncbi:MAG: protein jag [Chloroflexi bacterium]|nr:MAG: protein jag [Chloroflexota bacterium]
MSNQNVKSLDVSAKTVDEAIEQGLAQLQLRRDQVDIEVIKEGKRGVFGIGAEDAVVRLTPRSRPSAEQAEQKAPPQPPADNQPAEAPPATTPVEEVARRHLGALLRYMGIKAEIKVKSAPELVEGNEEAPLVLDITGRDLGILIGRQSQTLRALQYILRLMVSKEMGSWQPVIVDVESYRIRRHQSLRRLAERMAERAVANKRRVVLEAMPAYERRIIHLALKDHPAVYTKSVGSDENRKVTIIPK